MKEQKYDKPDFREEEVKPVMEKMYCPGCGCEMKFTGTVLTSYPAQYPHRCPECGYTYTTTEGIYPMLKYKPINEEQ